MYAWAWSHKLMAGHSSSGFSDRVQNSWFHQLWQVVQVLKLQSRPRPSRYHHHVWLLVWFSSYEMLCMYTPDVTRDAPPKKLHFCLISPQNICPKVLGIIKIFFGKCETNLCVLFGQRWLLSWNSPMDVVLASLFLIVESWNWQFIRCYSGFFYDLPDES